MSEGPAPAAGSIRVLFVEDVEDDALLAVRALKRSGWQVEWERVDTGPALRAALARGGWDVILSDFAMPTLTGLEALRIVQASGAPIPFILVSGAIGEETAVEVMRGGAHDCIMKDKLSRLPPAVERELREATMRREREEALESLRRELKLNATLAELSKGLIAMPEDLEGVAGLVLAHARELTGSRRGLVTLVDARTGATVALTPTAPAVGEDDGEELARLERACRTLCATSPVPGAPFFQNGPERGTEEPLLVAPVLSGERLLGLVAVAHPGRPYAEPDLVAVGRLADLFSIAIVNHQYLLEKEQLSARLRQVQKIEAIGTLAGGIAHDFNNILTPMIGYADMVRMVLPKDTKVWRYQDQVLKACSRARDLVQQILTLSRQDEEERTPTPLHPIVLEALRLLRSSIPSTIEIRQEIDRSCGLVLAAPTQVHQVVMNLCTNAYQAMRELGGILTVTLTRAESDGSRALLGLPPGRYVKLEISDTGGGMDRKTMDKIFDPYFTTKKKGEGTGLGLSVVESIVRRHGGHVSVASRVGVGSTFGIYLPVASEDACVAQEVPAGESSLTGAERLLVVDDMADIVEMTQEMLESLGYRVTGYTSSLEALAAFARDPSAFDLVITDLTMPNLTGIELARQLLRLRSDLPIILCTGLNEGSDEPSVPIRRYLKKPVSMHEYSQAVRQVLDEANSRGSGRPT